MSPLRPYLLILLLRSLAKQSPMNYAFILSRRLFFSSTLFWMRVLTIFNSAMFLIIVSDALHFLFYRMYKSMIFCLRSLKSFHLVCFFAMSKRSYLSSYSIFVFINLRLTLLFFAKIDLLNFYMMSFSWLTLGAIKIFVLTKSTVFFCSGMSLSLRLNSFTVSLHNEKVEYYTDFTKGLTSL